MAESYAWALIKSLHNMVEELKRENTRYREERDAAREEVSELKKKATQSNVHLRRPYGHPPSYTSFAVLVSTYI